MRGPKILTSQSGSALLAVLALMFILTLIGIEMVSTSNDDIEIAGNSKTSTQAFYTADAGQALAKSKLWAEYINWGSTNPVKNSGDIGDRNTYVKFLEGLGLSDGATIEVASYVTLSPGQMVESVMVSRQDMSGATVLSVASYGSADARSHQTTRATYRIEGEAFKGFDYAILANNVNCIMCHATIDNVDRIYNADAPKKGTFDRVKVASLESMLLRTTSAESIVAGTVYTRGIVTDKAGNPITNLSPTGMGLDGYAIGADGKITEPLNNVSLSNTNGSPLPQFGNLYMNYPTNEKDQTDGLLPASFPPPFPDDNGNRTVDDAEFAIVANKSNGSISGGVIYGVATGSSYAGASLPGAGNTAAVSQSYNGNLILVGTDANPIVLSGDISVDGDVVIQGKVKGTGQIFARGNVYVTGDLTYSDGSNNTGRTFGLANDGSQNALSLAAGKNIMVGDYLTPSGGNIGSTASIDPGNLSGNEKFSFTMSEITLFNRREWTKTQQFLPDKTGIMVPNTTYEPLYVPRFYTMNAGDPVYIYNKNTGGKGTYWDAASNSWMGSEHASSYDPNKLTIIPSNDPKLAGSKLVALSTSSSWISPSTLKSLWIADEANRPAGSDFKIDGQLYTNNSIFALARSASKTGGKMIMNGAMVASDIGVLVPTSLQLNYDQRLKAFLKIKDNSKVSFAQSAWYSE